MKMDFFKVSILAFVFLAVGIVSDDYKGGCYFGSFVIGVSFVFEGLYYLQSKLAKKQE
jgi:hypothetical protein